MDRPILRPIFLPAVLMALAMSACAPQPPEPERRDLQPPTAADASDEPLTPAAGSADGQPSSGADMDPCDPAAVQSLVGEQATDDVIEQARIGAGAEVARTLRPDQVVTMEYRAGRLNIDIDDAGTITGLRCG